jgi:hypothetical protein
MHRPIPAGQVWELPPLILHPFSDPSGPDKLLESSRAHLVLQGLLPNSGHSAEQLEERLLSGRFCEIRMLYYVGKDLERWVSQCLETVSREPALADCGIGESSFHAYLVNNPPEAVKAKLVKWGVADYRAIFMRSIGLNSVFADAPLRDILNPHFIRFYYRYADQLYDTRLKGEAFTPISAQNFTFDLYASGEYSRILSREWEEI